MQRALDLAREAKGKTFPNPAVGAIVVCDKGTVIGKGATQVYGGPHAEKVALAEAGERARGAVLYVTLEPCCHFGKTAPCTDAIMAAGIRKVVVSVIDPNPLVAGKGILRLREAGIEVQSGLLEHEARRINEDFFFSVTTKRAWVTLKLALTLDGRIADTSGNSRWITGEESRRYVHELRRCHAAVAVGRSTLHIDNPRLTVRHVTGYSPARIVFSSDENIPKNSFFFQNASNTRSIIVKPGTVAITKLSSGIEVWSTGNGDTLCNLTTFLQMAHEQGISSVFIEGGQNIASQFLEHGLVNRLYLFYGNRMVGKGKEGIFFSRGYPIDKSIVLSEIQHTILGSDVMISGLPIVENRACSQECLS